MTEPIDILLVDDEARNLDALEAILDDPSYRLLRADSADTALKLLLDHEVAAIVLDIKMPTMSGFELAAVIKGTRKFRQTPILFLTAYLLEDQDVIAGYNTGAVDYLTKPINPQILRLKVAVFAELFRKTRALAELNDKLEERVKERTAELARSEAALRAADRQKDEFLAILAHELRNPLAPLRTGLDLLLEAQKDGQPAPARTLGAMNRQLDHMVRLIDDLLDVSRISRGVLELQKEPVELGTIVQDAVESVRPYFERRQQTISVQSADGVSANVDPTRIAQILGNVLHNAVKYSPDGAQIDVELSRVEGRARIRVVDRGVGIPEDQLERVFRMFARVERPGVRSDQGLGIGLALARRLADLHGGALTATSAGDGRGATFTLELPALAQPSPATAGNGHATRGASTGTSILIIEDNPDIADTLADLLGDLGYQVSIARDGNQGVDAVREQHPQVVLCDLGLPGMDGVEVCKTVRQLVLEPRPIMIALTGWGRDDDRKRTEAAGFDHHLVKPIGAEKLQRVLRSLIP